MGATVGCTGVGGWSGGGVGTEGLVGPSEGGSVSGEGGSVGSMAVVGLLVPSVCWHLLLTQKRGVMLPRTGGHQLIFSTSCK